MSDHTGAYIHGTAPDEQRRLAGLNRMTNGPFMEFLRIAPGMHVLEVGSGLGILAAEVASAAKDVRVVGLEKSPQQLVSAIKAHGLSYVQGDAHQLEFSDASFDLVYARYLLEHVSHPQKVLGEMRRVLRPGGRIALCENDISLVRLDPPCPAFEKLWAAFASYQLKLGGDPFIGRRLCRLLTDAGFLDIELSVQPEIHWHGSAGFSWWIGNLEGNLESARSGIMESGLGTKEDFVACNVELSTLVRKEGASSHFVWNRAAATR